MSAKSFGSAPLGRGAKPWPEETLERAGERVSIYVGYQSGRDALGGENGGNGTGRSPVRKEIRVSRVRKTAAELVGIVNAVLFTADDLQLVFGPPSGRRRYLNILISQSDPTYLKTLQRFQRVVQQRNKLLRMLRDGAGRDRREGLLGR